MAKAETWQKVRYFEPTENWGDADAISDDLILRLDDFRHYLGIPCYITAGVSTSGHSGKSYHYREQGACAVDCVFPDYSGHPLDLILDATRFGFTGIGYYPHWQWKGEVVGGLHLDVRPMGLDADGTLNYRHSRWLGIMRDGKQVYLPLTYNNLKRYIGGSNELD